MPKSLGVRTRPSPKWCSQTRLTITRAVSGLSWLAIAWASSSRPLPLRERLAASRRRGPTGTAAAPPRPGCRGCRGRRRAGRAGSGASSSTIARGGAPGLLAPNSSTFRCSAWYCSRVSRRSSRGSVGLRRPPAASPGRAAPGGAPPRSASGSALAACRTSRAAAAYRSRDLRAATPAACPANASATSGFDAFADSRLADELVRDGRRLRGELRRGDRRRTRATGRRPGRGPRPLEELLPPPLERAVGLEVRRRRPTLSRPAFRSMPQQQVLGDGLRAVRSLARISVELRLEERRRPRPAAPCSSFSKAREAGVARRLARSAGSSLRLGRCWRRRRRASSSPPSGSGRTCGRGSGRRLTVRPSMPRVTTSMRSSMMSGWLFRNRRPSVRKPIAASGRLSLAELELVGGDLLDEELVVRQVLVERADDAVAVGVGVRVAPLFLEDVALGVGVAGDVEPVPPPPLAVAGRGEQAVDHLLVGVGRRVASNASTSSGVGGRPCRSNVARRIRTALGARGLGVSPLASSLAATNLSISFFTQPALAVAFTSGTAGSFGGWNDQWPLPSADAFFSPSFFVALLGLGVRRART